MSEQPSSTRRWLWVAGPEYYLDEDGDDRGDLDPGTGYVPDAWWTCAPQTRQGDLALLYRSRVRRDIAHLVVARSDAEVLDLPGSPFHGRHVCGYEVVDKLSQPLAFATISADPVLRTWAAVKVRFVRSSFPVPDDMWSRLLDLAGVDPGVLARQAADGITRIRLEKEIQRRLVAHPQLLDAAGLGGLTLVRAEYRFPDGRRADLVYTRGRGVLGRMVVIELKRGEIGPRAVEQVVGYRDLLDAQHRRCRSTFAVLIGDRLHPTAEPLVRRTRRLRFVPLSDLKIAWAQTPSPTPRAFHSFKPGPEPPVDPACRRTGAPGARSDKTGLDRRVPRWRVRSRCILEMDRGAHRSHTALGTRWLPIRLPTPPSSGCTTAPETQKTPNLLVRASAVVGDTGIELLPARGGPHWA